MLYLLLADGFEEVEAIATLDVIRRAEIKVLTVGVKDRFAEGAHGVKIEADIPFDKMDKAAIEGVILPGGMPGTLNLQKNDDVIKLIEECAEKGLLVASVCAAPMIVGSMGLLEGRKATCFPGYEDELLGATVTDESVVVDGSFITAQGAGVSLQFGAAIVDYIRGEEGKGNAILKKMQCKC